MGKKRHVLARLAYWQHRLGIQPWRVTVNAVAGPHIRQSDEETTLCRIERNPDDLSAVLHVALGRAPDELDNDICHECLHLLLGETNTLVQMLAGRLGGEARMLAQDQWRNVEERLVSMLQRALTPDA